MFVAYAHNLLYLFRYAFAHALGFHEQDGGSIHGIACVCIGFDSLQDHLIHHLDSSRYEAGGDNLRNGVGGVIHGIEHRDHGFDGFRQMYHAHNNFGNDAQRSFRTNQQACEIIAGSVLRPASYLHDIAFGGDDFKPQYVVGSDTVDERMGATRIFAHVTADGAGTLAAGIGNVIEALWV